MMAIANSKVSGNGKSDFPKSLLRLIKLFRFYGFSFPINNDEKNKSLIYHLKEYLMKVYNIFCIVLYICVQLLTSRDDEVLIGFDSKPVMKAIFFISFCIFSVDFIFSYILSLINGKKLIMLLKTKDIFKIDCNTKFANKMIAFIIIELLVIGASNVYIYLNYSFGISVGLQINKIVMILFAICMVIIYFGGVLILQVIYIYIVWIITSQIDNLKNNIPKGIITTH